MNNNFVGAAHRGRPNLGALGGAPLRDIMGLRFSKQFVMARGHPRMMKMIAKNELHEW